jgi:hypothetical protein
METQPNKTWIKYVIGIVIGLIGIGLLFLDQTKSFAGILIGIGIGKII